MIYNIRMREGVCFIVGAGEADTLYIERQDGDFVIAADGGYDYCVRDGVAVDLLVGDMDSSDLSPGNTECIRLPEEKDDTDMRAAINVARDRGYTKFVIFGGTGGRLSHTISNIQCLHELSASGIEAVMVGERELVTVLCDGSFDFGREYEGYISVFSLSETASVTLKGLKYPLDSYPMTNTYPIGTSNEFTGEEATVTVNGSLLVAIENNTVNRTLFLGKIIRRL